MSVVGALIKVPKEVSLHKKNGVIIVRTKITT